MKFYLLSLIAFLLSSPSIVCSAPITFSFSGEITQFIGSPSAFGSIRVGDTYTGTYTFDSTNYSHLSILGLDIYNFPVLPELKWDIQFNEKNYQLNTNDIIINDLLPSYSGSTDIYEVEGTTVDIYSSIILSDPTRTALTSNALPLDAPDLLDFASKEFQLSVWVQEKHTAIGSINTLKIVSVPEPSIIALISIGLVSIGFVRRRAKKYKHIIMEK
ncbi:MAG: PEP-CTERM sorting domain-containing protein [Gammaproteobacteria bacterium]|jgi:hypothetical protein|nr:PEP-CTERM sorting domain-containing protein [Gammaproteobacteria bacterium]MBT4075445.1 PEP-CTERM sorting domain-containing protein [Gammaproteobacteria bacterium]MBT4193893.1 PEP-CTERM sorting domain-containing protein [Gammaproteobacteria bacterium]MBT4451527.1 PEP-CTERM sorting domain-containing protein [Gammaproteobacteria bacterium]MBT4861329.1 PEP-CTERM sorting domain-containing protein [Gammaproteobacteria bacterium]